MILMDRRLPVQPDGVDEKFLELPDAGVILEKHAVGLQDPGADRCSKTAVRTKAYRKIDNSLGTRDNAIREVNLAVLREGNSAPQEL